jgi:uracil phosphoribosyltransferase
MAMHEPSANLPSNVFTLVKTSQLEALYTIIRDKDTSRYVADTQKFIKIKSIVLIYGF